MKDFIERIRSYIARHNMLVPNSRVLVAVSGGADSVVLLHLLHSLGYDCVAAHCNFHLRGEESMRDERFVRDLCHRLGVRLETTDFDVPARMAADHSSLEMACRDLRYEWFEATRLAQGCHSIAVAHHRDDNIETLLLNLLRGTGIAGVAGIKPVNSHIIRPLLCVSRHEIEEYLQQVGEHFIIDSTNAKNDVKRNRLRNIILPAIREHFPAADTGLSRSLDNLLSCNELYESMLSQWLAEVVTCSDYTTIDIKRISQCRGASALLFAALRPFGFNSVQADDILNTYLRDNSTGKSFIAGDYKAVIDRDNVIVDKTVEQQKIIPLDITQGGIDEPIRLIIRKTDLTDFDWRWCDGRRRVCFGEQIASCRNLSIRHWQEGDRFKPFGMKGRSRLVSDLFTDLKLSDAEKRRTWLLEADGEIVWVIGYRSTEAFRITRGTDLCAYCFSLE